MLFSTFVSALWAHVISFFVASFGHMHGCHCLAHSFVGPLGTCFFIVQPIWAHVCMLFACMSCFLAKIIGSFLFC